MYHKYNCKINLQLKYLAYPWTKITASFNFKITAPFNFKTWFQITAPFNFKTTRFDCYFWLLNLESIVINFSLTSSKPELSPFFSLHPCLQLCKYFQLLNIYHMTRLQLIYYFLSNPLTQSKGFLDLQNITSSQWSLPRDLDRLAVFRLNKPRAPLDGVFSLSASEDCCVPIISSALQKKEIYFCTK